MAYNPILKISGRGLIRKERRLPIQGRTLVPSGAKVKAEDCVAQADLPGPVELVNLSVKLGVEPRAIRKFLLKKEGEKVFAGEVMARCNGFLGFFRSEFVSPVSGSVESVSEVTGKITLRSDPVPVQLHAYVEGVVESVIAGAGVILRTWGAEVQGIFGFGGETWGSLRLAVSDPGEILSEDHLAGPETGDFRNSILVGGGCVTREALEKAVELGVRAVIAGGMEALEMEQFLRGSAGAASGAGFAGSGEKGITVILTEGFGKIPMMEKTFRLLKSCEGRTASVNGTTQIRAGVIRPEILVPFLEEGIPQDGEREEKRAFEFQAGMKVRGVRVPYLGQIGKIRSLPSEPRSLETEAKMPVAEVEFSGGAKGMIPRANLEILEE